MNGMRRNQTMIEQAIADLLGYALRAGLIEDCDRTWAANRLLAALKLAR